jgi:hypothetical protein
MTALARAAAIVNCRSILSSERERERPTSANSKVSDSNKNLVIRPDGYFIPRETSRLSVCRNMRFRLRISSLVKELIFSKNLTTEAEE